MKILTVCSGLDFINYTRKATIEAIHDLNPELEILMYNSVLNLRKKKNKSDRIKTHNYHFWVVEKLRKLRSLVLLEYFLRRPKWKEFFSSYEIILFIDSNQYFLLPYLSDRNKLIYLVRDPSVLQDQSNYFKELPIIKRANAILGISENLCFFYFSKYYGFIPNNVHLWPNTVDTTLWNYNSLKVFKREKNRPVIGLAGNINYVIDIELLIYLANNLPEYDFELAGKIDLNEKENLQMTKLLMNSNVKHLGFIPYNDFPSTVINWDIGLVAAKADNEYANYLNNNKQYQYLALGKPFVSYRYNADYSVFEDLVFIATDKVDFVEKIKMALNKSTENNVVERGIKIASELSSERRARQFLEIAENLK
jgi:hypothetical protein